FVNGVGQSVTAVAGAIGNDNTGNYIGKEQGATPFNGLIDEVKVYNYSRTADEINQSAKGVNNLLPVFYQNATNVTGSIIYGDPLSGIELTRNGSYVTYMNDSKLVGWWDFDEADAAGNTIANDSSGWNNSGTLTNGVSRVAGRFRGGLQFDGIDDSVRIADSPSLDGMTNLTITAWINPKETGGESIVTKSASTSGTNTDYFFAVNPINSTNQMRFFITNTAGSGILFDMYGGQVRTNEWQFVAATWDGTNGVATLYVDSTQVNQQTGITPQAIRSSTADVEIGKNGNSCSTPGISCDWFNGTIDEVKIFNRSLGAVEIQNEHRRGSGMHEEKQSAGIKEYNVTYWASQNFSARNFSSIVRIEKARSGLELFNNATRINTTGLVGYWRFETGSGTVASDSSIYGNDGTLTNMNTSNPGGGNGNSTSGWNATDCYLGNCLKFDRVNDYVITQPTSLFSFGSSGPFSAEAWVKTFDPGTIVGKVNHPGESGWYLRTDVGGTLTLVVASKTSSSSIVSNNARVTDGRWHHVVGVRSDETTASLYIDGVLDKTATISSMNTDGVFSLAIGRAGEYTGGEFSNATIDEVRVWSRALSAGEVAALYATRQIYSTPTQFYGNVTTRPDNDNLDLNLYRNGTPIQQYRHRDGSTVLYLPFEEGSTNSTADHSVYRNNGTLVNGTAWNTSGKFGNALTFDGVNDYVEVAHNNSLNLGVGGYSISAWFKTSAIGKSEDIVDKGTLSAQYQFTILSNDRLFSSTWAGAGQFNIYGSSNVSDGRWHHGVVAISADGLTGKIYVDGVLDNTSTSSTAYNTDNTGNLLVGADWAKASGFFNGTIDEVKIFNRTLTAAEVYAEYAANSLQLNESAILGAGTYFYKLNTSGSNNYTSEELVLPVTIDRKNPEIAIANTTGTFVNTTGLVGYWRFEGPDLNDSSGQGNYGNMTGANATAVQGRFGRALDFDGKDDFVVIGNQSAYHTMSTVTVAAWIKTNATSTNRGIVAKMFSGTSSFALRMDNDIAGLAEFSTGNGTDIHSTSTTLVNDNKWHLLAGTYNGTHQRLYVDGALEDTDARYGLIGQSDELLCIGVFCTATGTGGSAYAYNGSIDEVMIFNRSLTASEILQLNNSRVIYSTQTIFIANQTNRLGAGDVDFNLYQNDTPVARFGTKDSQLVGYWKFDEVNGTNASDTSAFKNHGSWTGTTNVTYNITSNCKFGTCLSFDGVDDYIDAGSGTSLDNIGLITITAWIKPNNGGEGNYGRIYDKGGNKSFFVSNASGEANTLQFIQDFSTAQGRWRTPVNSITLNGWNHIAVTFDDSSSSNDPVFYINGVSQTVTEAATPSGTRSLDGAANAIVGNLKDGTRTFDGTIDEIKIFNRSLTANEIYAEYSGGLIENQTIVEASGQYFYLLNTSGGHNYTSSSILLPLTIEKATPSLGIQNNNTFINEGKGTGAVLALSFDEANGTVAFDSSGYGNDGSWTGNNNVTRNTSGRFGNALTFDGVDDAVVVGDKANLEGMGSLTVSAWILPKMNNGNDPIVAKMWTGTTSYALRTLNDNPGIIQFSTYTDSQVSSQSTVQVNDSAWHHVAGTYDGSNQRLYVDGVLQDTDARTGTIGNSEEELCIGAFCNGNVNPGFGFNGTIDEVRIYNYSMSADDINASARGIFNDIHYIYGQPSNTSGFLRQGDDAAWLSLQRNGSQLEYLNDSSLVGWWHFDEVNAIGNTVANDSSGWNSTGELVHGTNHTTGKIRNAL
ncbi:MAG: hypothetical protein HY517_00725, partial [Candidatus Aenigmarchaeota archaeon]|nr:hypothetical protein [Candidatus Aenigmarchaeota archaeon]